MFETSSNSPQTQENHPLFPPKQSTKGGSNIAARCANAKHRCWFGHFFWVSNRLRVSNRLGSHSCRLAAHTVSSPNFDRKHPGMLPERLEGSQWHPWVNLERWVRPGASGDLSRGGNDEIAAFQGPFFFMRKTNKSVFFWPLVTLAGPTSIKPLGWGFSVCLFLFVLKEKSSGKRYKTDRIVRWMLIKMYTHSSSHDSCDFLPSSSE